MIDLSLAELTQAYGLMCLVVSLPALGATILLQLYLPRRMAVMPKTAVFDATVPSAIGLGLGVLLIGLITGSIALAGGFNPSAEGFAAFDYEWGIESPDFAARLASMFVVQTLYEELWFRSFVTGLLALAAYWIWKFASDTSRLGALKQFEKKDEDSETEKPEPAQVRRELMAWLICGTAINLLVNLFFAFAHGTNPSLTELGQVNIWLAGMVLGQLFWMQGHVLGAWLMHFAWNFGLVALGLPVSGYSLSPPLTSLGTEGAVAGALSGGSFGPEGSYFSTIYLLAALVIVIWLSWSLNIKHALKQCEPAEEAVAEAE